MKTFFKNLIILVNTTFYLVFERRILSKKSQFYLVLFRSDRNNTTNLIHSKINRTKIHLTGENNRIEAEKALISDTTITIKGTNNKLILGSGVKLRGATINIRGNNCNIKIGQGTTFGGIRMVNVGENNSIMIGQDCLFADFIELWASDTHSIFNTDNEKINPEMSVTIGDRVWVGSHVIILKGVSIYNDSVIGMGTLVTKNVPSNTINVGSPNRTIKEGISWKLDY